MEPVVLLSYEGSPVDAGIDVVALGDHEWKLLDLTLPADDASSVLAYVDKEDAGYAVLDLTIPPGSWRRFECLAAVISFISGRRPARSSAS